MARARFVSLKALDFNVVAGLDGGPVPKGTREFDLPSAGASSLALAGTEQRGVERLREAFIREITPLISRKNAVMLRALFVEEMMPSELASIEGCRRQAIYQRLTVLGRRFEEINGWWAARLADDA